MDIITTFKQQYNYLGKRESAEYTLRRFYVDKFLFSFAEEFLYGTVLDVGGTQIKRRGLFNINNFAKKVIFANITDKNKPNILADAHHLPIKNKCLNSVLFSEVFEHLAQPMEALAEANRILCPGGNIVICAPFLYRIHGDPYDYSRFTDHMWKQMLEKMGFSIVYIEKQGYFYSVLHDIVNLFIQEKIKFKVLRRIAQFIIIQTKKWSISKDLLIQKTRDPFLSSFTTGFGIIAKKATDNFR